MNRVSPASAVSSTPREFSKKKRNFDTTSIFARLVMSAIFGEAGEGARDDEASSGASPHFTIVYYRMLFLGVESW